jgi:hypothetical protein
LPLVGSIIQMQDLWSGQHYHLVEKKVTREQLFDLSVATEANARLDKSRSEIDRDTSVHSCKMIRRSSLIAIS